jgi:hypothetical protein
LPKRAAETANGARADVEEMALVDIENQHIECLRLAAEGYRLAVAARGTDPLVHPGLAGAPDRPDGPLALSA